MDDRTLAVLDKPDKLNKDEFEIMEDPPPDPFLLSVRIISDPLRERVEMPRVAYSWEHDERVGYRLAVDLETTRIDRLTYL